MTIRPWGAIAGASENLPASSVCERYFVVLRPLSTRAGPSIVTPDRGVQSKTVAFTADSPPGRSTTPEGPEALSNLKSKVWLPAFFERFGETAGKYPSF